MEVRSLGFRTDIYVRRIAGSEVADRGDHIVVRTPANPDFYWGNFLLVPSPLAPGDAGRWLAVSSTEFPGARHVAIGIDGCDGEVGDISGLLADGMALEVDTVLTAAGIREPARPHADADIRPLVTDEDWAGVSGLRSAVYPGDGRRGAEHLQFLARRLAEERHTVEAGDATYFAAFVDGRPVSNLGLVVDGSGVASFQTVETHPDHRRQGLAGALVHAAGAYGRRYLGARTFVIIAEPDGPAINLYRSLGFVDTEKQVELARPG